MGRGDIDCDFLNGKLSLLGEDEVVHKICQFVEEGGFHIVVTCDAYAFTVASKDKEFSDILRSADLVTPDGMGVVLGAKLLRIPVKERVAGVDIVTRLLPTAEEKGWSLFFLGGIPGVADKAVQNIKKSFPKIKVVGCRDGYFTKEQEKFVVEKIRKSSADILLVGMGIPKQEKFIWRNRDRLGVKVAIGVGGTLDVLSGKVRRAPRWMRKSGLEWLYRLIFQPSKIGKVARLPFFYFLIIRDFLKRIKLRGNRDEANR